MEERPAIWRVAANILNKRTAEKKVSSNLRVGRGAKNSSPLKPTMLGTISHCLRFGSFVWYDVSKGKFGPKKDEVTGEWRKLHNDELNDLYSSPTIVRVIKSRRMRWARHVARMGEMRDTYRVLAGKPEGKRPLGRQRRRWKYNTK
jgi:hypothetical protein